MSLAAYLFVTVLLGFSLAGNVVLYVTKQRDTENLRNLYSFMESGLSARINYLRGLLSRPWINMSTGRLHTTLR